MPEVSLHKWPVANCAEFNAVNNALHAGVKIENMTIYTNISNDMPPFPRCDNCLITTVGTRVLSD